MASILGFDLNRAIDGIAGRFDQLVGPQPGNPFGAAAPGGANPFTAGALGGGNPFGAAAPGDRNPFGAIGPQAGNPFGTVGSGQGNPFGGAALGGNPFAPASMFPAAKAAPVTVGDGATTPGGGTGGLAPGVAKWADQTRQVFGDIQGLDPDTMLAIMTNESGGDPNAYNAAGDAWGLFQDVGLGSKDPQVQFQAAHQLAQQKMAEIQKSYAANGLNPDARTRARDFALAWAGHFDYATGQPNPNSRDVGSGQTAEQLANIFLSNYDRIKAAQQGGATAGGTRGLAGVTPGVGGQIMQEFGPTDYSRAHPDTYAYGNAYGLAGSQHPGVDWAVPLGTRVATPAGGTVTYAGGTGYYTDTMSGADPAHSGEFLVTLDNGDQLILGHLASINVQVGQRVNAGDLIGLSGGSDGAHVHVEVRVKDPSMPSGYRIVDPRSYFGG